MKKIGVVLFLCLYLSLGFGVIAQAPPGVNDFGVGETGDVDKFVNYSEQTQEFIEEEKYKLLADKWKEILLKNRFLSAVDGFFRKINFVFFILFGEDYDFTFNFLLLVVVWAIYLVFLNDIFGSFSPTSKGISFAIVVGFNIILAQIGHIAWFSNLIFRFFFFDSGFLFFNSEEYSAIFGIWKWIGPIVAILIFILIIASGKVVKKNTNKRKMEVAKIKEETHRKILEEEAEAILDASEDSFSEKVKDTVDSIEDAIKSLEKAASFEEAKKMFNKFSIKFHPDKGGSNEAMSALNSKWDKIRRKFGK